MPVSGDALLEVGNNAEDVEPEAEVDEILQALGLVSLVGNLVQDAAHTGDSAPLLPATSESIPSGLAGILADPDPLPALNPSSISSEISLNPFLVATPVHMASAVPAVSTPTLPQPLIVTSQPSLFQAAASNRGTIGQAAIFSLDQSHSMTALLSDIAHAAYVPDGRLGAVSEDPEHVQGALPVGHPYHDDTDDRLEGTPDDPAPEAPDVSEYELLLNEIRSRVWTGYVFGGRGRCARLKTGRNHALIFRTNHDLFHWIAENHPNDFENTFLMHPSRSSSAPVSTAPRLSRSSSTPSSSHPSPSTPSSRSTLSSSTSHPPPQSSTPSHTLLSSISSASHQPPVSLTPTPSSSSSAYSSHPPSSLLLSRLGPSQLFRGDTGSLSTWWDLDTSLDNPFFNHSSHQLPRTHSWLYMPVILDALLQIDENTGESDRPFPSFSPFFQVDFPTALGIRVRSPRFQCYFDIVRYYRELFERQGITFQSVSEFFDGANHIPDEKQEVLIGLGDHITMAYLHNIIFKLTGIAQ